MDNKMEDYYKVLQWLRETHIDRQYPYEFDETDNIEHSENVELVEEHHSDFDKSLHIQNIQADSKVRIHLPRVRDYNDIDYFEILFYSAETITPSDLTIGFSNTRSGVVNQVELKADDISHEDTVINEDGYHQFRYHVRKANTSMKKKKRWI